MKKILLTFAVLAFSGNLLAGTICHVAQSEGDSNQYTKILFNGWVDDTKGLTLFVKPNGTAVEAEKLAEGVLPEQIPQLLKDLEGAPIVVAKKQDNGTYVLVSAVYSSSGNSKTEAAASGFLSFNQALSLITPKLLVSCVEAVNPADVTNKPTPVK